MARPKVTVVGAGNVGAATAQYVVERALADVVITDIVEGLPQGKALDLLQAGPIHGYDCRLVGANDYKETAGSDIVVITAGLDEEFHFHAELLTAASPPDDPARLAAVVVLQSWDTKEIIQVASTIE